MWWCNLPHNPTAYDDDWEDQPKQGPFYKWILGVVVPILAAAFGAHAVLARQAAFSYDPPLNLYGLNAVALGGSAISLAVFLHCHYFWGNIYNQAWFAMLGKILAACGFVAGLIILIVRVGVMGVG